jgi:hypothetical protein
MLSVIYKPFFSESESRYAECCYVECRSTLLSHQISSPISEIRPVAKFRAGQPKTSCEKLKTRTTCKKLKTRTNARAHQKLAHNKVIV